MSKVLATLFTLLVLGSCATPATDANMGDVRGTVTGWPGAPQGGSTIPAKDAKVTFLDGSNHEVTSVRTDSEGAFHASLRAGRYLVRVMAFGLDPIVISVNGTPSKTSPVYLTVTAGVPTTLNLVVDTGIR